MADTAAVLRSYFQFARDWLEGTMQGVTPDVAHWQPGGRAHPIGAHYLHVLTSEDYLLQVLVQGGAPLMMTSFHGKTGADELPPMGNRDEWARRVRVDLALARVYAEGVYAATDAFLASANDQELARAVDLSSVAMGTQPVAFVLNLMLGNRHNHCGEISCLKGLQGLSGYPG